MRQTLRNRLILSHIIPFLIIIPLTGLAILYVTETQVLLPSLSKELVGEARLLAEMVNDQPEILGDFSITQSILDQARPNLATRIMILAPDGRLLISSDPTDSNRIGQKLAIPDLATARRSEVISKINFSKRLQAEVVDVYAPVFTSDNRVAGIIRMSYPITTVYEEFIQLRYLIVTILVISLLVGVLLGSTLALNISTPLNQVIQVVCDLAQGSRKEALTEHGPEEVKRLMRAVNQLAERLSSLEEARHRLLANLVHEIGRPLGALHTAIQALQLDSEKDPKVIKEMLTGMKEETGRLQYLLDDLSHLHDQVLGILELDRQTIALGEWLPGVLQPWEVQATVKGLSWQISIPLDFPTLKIDPLRIAQVVGNLLSNAIKYTPTGGSVNVTAGIEGEEVWIKISDTGTGIPVGELEKIFTPFYRGIQGGRITQGMGLGLSIAHDLVEAHGGRLEVKSQPGLGSQFTIWLPSNDLIIP